MYSSILEEHSHEFGSKRGVVREMESIFAKKMTRLAFICTEGYGMAVYRREKSADVSLLGITGYERRRR